MPRFLTPVDLARNELQNARMQLLAGDPDTPIAGLFYLNTTSGRARYYTGSGWITIDAGGGDAETLGGYTPAQLLDLANATGTRDHTIISDFDAQVLTARLDALASPNAPVSLGGQRIEDLADPTSAQDAATRAYVLAQVAALVDSAPGVLDTLNELAAALGDDPNFATTLAGQVAAAKERANHTGTQEHTTISDWSVAVDARQEAWGYAATVGDGTATSILVTHNLGTRDVAVELYTTATPYESVIANYQRTTTDVVTLQFAVAPAAGELRALIRRVA